jgi:outer membrane protein TolC
MNHIRTRFLPVALVAVALFVGAHAASAQEPLSLDDAIAIAIKNNRDINAASHSVANADLALATARSYRLPQFSVEALGAQSITQLGVDFPAGAFGTFPGIGPVPSVDTRVTSPRRPLMLTQASLTQPISQLFKINLNVKASAVGRNIEHERERQTMQSVAAKVRKAYYGLLQTDAGIRAADAVLEASRAFDGVVGDRVMQRVALRGDSLQSQL